MLTTIWMCTHEWSDIASRSAFVCCMCHHALSCVSALALAISRSSLGLRSLGARIAIAAIDSASVSRSAAADGHAAQATADRQRPDAEAEAAEHQQRALGERAALRQQPELHRGVVEVEEAARAADQAVAQLDVVDAVQRQELVGRRDVAQLAAVRARDPPRQAAERRRRRSAGPRVSMRRSGNARRRRCAWRVERVDALERPVGQRVLVAHVDRAAEREVVAAAAAPAGLPAVAERGRSASARAPATSVAARSCAAPARPPWASTPRRRCAAGCGRTRAPAGRASTARRIARAIRSGSSAREIALASSTASQPISIASAASDAVPMPASRITGTRACSTISRRL